MTVAAFAPGHVSGFFAVHTEAEDVRRRGSRGGGWCLDEGATALVSPGTAGVAIRMDGRPAVANVTRLALHKLAPDAALDVDLRLALPVGQGFGMSAAGTLAACLAAASLLDLEPETALEAAHAAEVESGTGLGDAVAAWQGSGELRLRPGLPPHGQVARVDPPQGAAFLYAVVGDPIPTAAIIGDPAWQGATRALGDAAVDRVLAAGRPQAWQALLSESARFSRDLGLMPEEMRRLGTALPAGVAWGQCMLGTTLWATGAPALLDQAEGRLRTGARQVFRAGVDVGGARLVRG